MAIPRPDASPATLSEGVDPGWFSVFFVRHPKNGKNTISWCEITHLPLHKFVPWQSPQLVFQHHLDSSEIIRNFEPQAFVRVFASECYCWIMTLVWIPVKHPRYFQKLWLGKAECGKNDIMKLVFPRKFVTLTMLHSTVRIRRTI